MLTSSPSGNSTVSTTCTTPFAAGRSAASTDAPPIESALTALDHRQRSAIDRGDGVADRVGCGCAFDQQVVEHAFEQYGIGPELGVEVGRQRLEGVVGGGQQRDRCCRTVGEPGADARSRRSASRGTTRRESAADYLGDRRLRTSVVATPPSSFRRSIRRWSRRRWHRWLMRHDRSTRDRPHAPHVVGDLTGRFGIGQRGGAVQRAVLARELGDDAVETGLLPAPRARGARDRLRSGW